jgi:polyhydroxybutyrate depolymerase
VGVPWEWVGWEPGRGWCGWRWACGGPVGGVQAAGLSEAWAPPTQRLPSAGLADGRIDPGSPRCWLPSGSLARSVRGNRPLTRFSAIPTLGPLHPPCLLPLGPRRRAPTRPLRRPFVIFVVLASAMVGLAACGSSGSSASSTTAAGAAAPASNSSVPASPSPGCSKPAAARPPGTTTAALDADGLAGSYVQHVPPGFPRPLPLVIDLHGYSESAAIQTDVSDWATFGDTHGLIAVAPQINRTVQLWDTGLGSSDLAWFGTLLNTVEANECIDRNRVDVDGYSDGAFMTSAVACQFASQVAAVAPVAGIQAVSGCHPSRPVPVIAFHGTADPFVSYGGGLGAKALALPAPNGQGTLGQSGAAGASAKAMPGSSIPDQAKKWAARSGCSNTASYKTVANKVTLISYPCPSDATVELYRVTGGGHAWPGSTFCRSIASVIGYTTFAISADDLIWAFFQAHPLHPPVKS